jgi:Phage portal protein
MSRRSRNRNRFGKGRFRGDFPGATVKPVNPNAGAANRTSGPPGADPMGARRTPMNTNSRAPAGPRDRRGGRADVTTPSGRLPQDNRAPALRHNPNGGISRPTSYEDAGGAGGPAPGDIPWHSQDSQYRNSRPMRPPDSIRDVDIDWNWFTPFQPVMPFGPPFVNYPREWDYPVGLNLEYISRRQELCNHLRLMSRSNGILRTVIERRKDQFIRMPGAFQLKDKPEKKDKRITELKEFFRKPDRKHTYAQWVFMLLDDRFVIDAATIYRGWRRRDGKPYVLEVLDGRTIKPLVDDAGRIPDFPNPAYQQVIKGLPMINLCENELIYAPMRPTPELPIYGLSEVEMIMLEATQAIRRLLYQVNFWNEGTIPDVWAQTPTDWTPQQVAMFQAYHDSLYGGNLSQKSRVRFMPGGVAPEPIKGSAGELLKSEYDEWLARIICFTFSMSPQPFINQMNRATAETAQEQAETEGLHPLMTWWKDAIMDRIVLEDFGYDDIEWVWTPNKDVDPVKQANTLTVYVKGGIMTVNEARDQLGLPEVPEGDTLFIETGSGGVPLSHAIEPPPEPAPVAAPGAAAPAERGGAPSAGASRGGGAAAASGGGAGRGNAGRSGNGGSAGAGGNGQRKVATAEDGQEALPQPQTYPLVKKKPLTGWNSY